MTLRLTRGLALASLLVLAAWPAHGQPRIAVPVEIKAPIATGEYTLPSNGPPLAVRFSGWYCQDPVENPVLAHKVSGMTVVEYVRRLEDIASASVGGASAEERRLKEARGNSLSYFTSVRSVPEPIVLDPAPGESIERTYTDCYTREELDGFLRQLERAVELGKAAKK